MQKLEFQPGEMVDIWYEPSKKDIGGWRGRLRSRQRMRQRPMSLFVSKDVLLIDDLMKSGFTSLTLPFSAIPYLLTR